MQSELIPMLPGDILRYEREKQGLSIERAAESSKIKISVLQAIESGNTESIPSVYLRGYIRNYAHFLGVDSEQLDDHMGNARGAEPEIKSVFEVQRKSTGSERWLKASSYLVASALIATLAWQFTHQAVRFSQGEVSNTNPAENANSAASTAAPASRHLNASIASIELLKQDEEQAESTAPQSAWTAVDTVSESAGEELAVTGALRISTSADTWVEIHDENGTQLEMDLIRADESRTYDGKAPFRVLIGRASSVRLYLEGEEVDLAPHTRGNVARVTLGERVLAEAPEAEPVENH